MRIRLRKWLPNYMLDKPTKFDGMPQTQNSLWKTVENVKHTDKFVESCKCRNVK
jgi:hypothetical protein